MSQVTQAKSSKFHSGNIAFIDLQAQQQAIRSQLDVAIARLLDHGQYILGPEVRMLEDELAKFCGAKYAITCASGTDALLLALMAKGVGPGDAVFVPAFTFPATAEVVAQLGATPVFIDILPDTFNMCPSSLAAAVQSLDKNLTAVGVMPVDLFGQPADYASFAQIAQQHNLWIIDDAAQSFGASLNGKLVGTLAEITCTSFFPAKPLGCYGDGGALFTDDPELVDIIKSCRVHGQGIDKYNTVRLGMTGRLDTLQAAILLEKLKLFPEELQAKQVVADRYSQAFQSIATVPTLMAGATSSWAQYTLCVDNRDELQAKLKEYNIPTALYYPTPLNSQPPYQQYPCAPQGLPNTENICQKVISLPMHPYLQRDTQDYIIETVLSIC